jgi:hypothetical protein
MFALLVTRFTLGSRKQLILVVVLIALTSVLQVALQNKIGSQCRKKHSIKKPADAGFFVPAI